VLGIDPRALCMLTKFYIAELHPSTPLAPPPAWELN
jgi:hypothetical protein